MRSITVLTATLMCLSAGCDKPAPAPSGKPAAPKTTPDVANADQETTALRFHGLVADLPSDWEPFPPDGSMRTANFHPPALEDGAQAVVIIFAPTIGGTLEQNITRWTRQWRAESGGEPIVEILDLPGKLPITLVEISGSHRGMRDLDFIPGRAVVHAVVERPTGRSFMRLLGPRQAVEAHRQAFLNFVRETRRDIDEPSMNPS